MDIEASGKSLTCLATTFAGFLVCVVGGEGGIDSEGSDIFTAVLAVFLDEEGVVGSQESDALAATLVVVLSAEGRLEEESELCIDWYLRRRYFRHWTSIMSTAIRQVASDSSYRAS